MDGAKKRVLVAIGIVEEAGRYLVARRPAGVALADHWEFPGGKQEPGETPEAAAERELKEEMGIDVTAIGQLPVVEHDYPHAHVVLTPVLCRRTAGEPRAIHCVDPRWVTLEELKALPMPEGNATLLRSIVHRVQNQNE